MYVESENSERQIAENEKKLKISPVDAPAYGNDIRLVRLLL